MRRSTVAVMLLAAAVASAAADPPRRSSLREQVGVHRVQVDAVVLPRGDDPSACRLLQPSDILARVSGEEWAVEAIDWDDSGVRESRSLHSSDACLQVAVYVGRFTWQPTVACPFDPRIRIDSSYAPPAGFHHDFQHDAFLAARSIAGGLRDCDRAAFWVAGPGHALHTRWVHGPAEALRVLDELEQAAIGSPTDSPDILETPGLQHWTDLVAALASIRGRKDLVVIGEMDEWVYRHGYDPWRLASLADDARRARVTIHRVSLAPGGRVYLPGSAETLATGGMLFRGGARARITEEVRRRAFCRARLTLVPPPGARPRRIRSVSLEDRSGRFDLAGTAWLVEHSPSHEETLAHALAAGDADPHLHLQILGVDRCSPAATPRSFRCEARLLVRPSGPLPAEPAAAGLALWNGSRSEFSHLYALDAGGPLRAPRSLRLPFTSSRGRRTLCVLLFDPDGTFLASSCRGLRVPPPRDTAESSPSSR